MTRRLRAIRLDLVHVEVIPHLLLEGLVETNIHDLKFACIPAWNELKNRPKAFNLAPDLASQVAGRLVQNEHRDRPLCTERCPYLVNPLQHLLLIHPRLVLDRVEHTLSVSVFFGLRHFLQDPAAAFVSA